MKIYVINTECGLMRDFQAESIEAAKEQYAAEFHFDFDAVADTEGSWYWISEDGVRVEEETAAMPQW